jgi:tetratricopeptide repeat protein 30
LTNQSYLKIKEGKHRDAIDILNYQLQINTKVCFDLFLLKIKSSFDVFLLFLQSRAALSLLAYCYYQIQDYVNASDLYEQLSGMCPDQEQYKIYYAQALYKCGLNAEALKVSAQIDNSATKPKVVKLQAAIKYAEDDIKACMEYVERTPPDDPAVEINKACICFKENKFEEALDRFRKAGQILGSRPGKQKGIK